MLNLSDDNVASILKRNSISGTAVLPSIPLFNAVSGSEQIVTDGVNTGGDINFGVWNELHPRTGAGFTADNKLLLVTVDGRQPGFSGGMTTPELADLMIHYGAVQAINLDGGGSTTMVFNDGAPRVVNSPSDGGLRSVATNLGVFAPAATQRSDLHVFSDFYNGDPGTFSLRPGYSGSTGGILDAQSSSVVTDETSFMHGWSQKLTITDDPAAQSDPENPGGWFVRHNSGSAASRSQNTPRPTTGYVGFWAMTTDAGVEVSIALDNTANTTADRGLPKP